MNKKIKILLMSLIALFMSLSTAYADQIYLPKEYHISTTFLVLLISGFAIILLICAIILISIYRHNEKQKSNERANEDTKKGE